MPQARHYTYAVPWDAEGLSNGDKHLLWTPGDEPIRAGDLLLDVMTEVIEAFDGTNPKFDFGFGIDGSNGVNNGWGSSVVDVDAADAVASPENGAIILCGGTAGRPTRLSSSVTANGYVVTFKVPDAGLYCWVTQNGAATGADPGNSAGLLHVTFQVVTPRLRLG